MRAQDDDTQDDIAPEYDFDYSKATWGKYYDRLMREGSNVVLLDADVAEHFRDSAAVNEALRSLLKSRATQDPARRPAGRSKKTAVTT